MQQRNPKGKFPLAGALGLGLTVVGVGLLIATTPLSLGLLLRPWSLSRAAGLIAYVLLWASVVLGLLQSTGLLKGTTSPIANIDVHNFIALAAIYTGLFHGLILLWDSYISFSLTDILVPFAGSFKPALVGMGSASLYLMVLVTITTYLRGRLRPTTWRRIHLISLAGFVLALAHGLLVGTDAAAPAVAFLYRFTGFSIVALLGHRVYKGVFGHANPARRG